jgi:hypothetical protein
MIHAKAFRSACCVGAVRLVSLVAVLGIGAVDAASAQSTEDGAKLLKSERWAEGQYGLSMQPPKQTQAVEQAADNSIVKFVGQDATFSLYIRTGGSNALAFKPVKGQSGQDRQSRWQQQTDEAKTKRRLTREFLQKRGERQFSFLYPKSVRLKDERPNFSVAGHEATKLYFLVSREAGDWVAGQAYVILSKNKVAVFQLECDASSWQRHKRRFEAWLSSVRIPDPEKLSQQRSALLDAAEQWRQSLSLEQMLESLNPSPQWFRIRRGDKDVGYMRVRREQTRELGQKGIRVQYNKHIKTEQAVYDTSGRFFASFDGQTELWSLKTTKRMRQAAGRSGEGGGQSDLPQPGKPPASRTWTETGLHADQKLRVTREAPAEGVEKSQWAIPPKAYLSQVGARLWFSQLPKDESRTMLFYAYASPAGELSLRRVRIQPLKDGRFAVRIKPTPQRAERVVIYNRQRQLVRKRMADGLVITPASKQQLRTIWNLE